MTLGRLCLGPLAPCLASVLSLSSLSVVAVVWFSELDLGLGIEEGLGVASFPLLPLEFLTVVSADEDLSLLESVAESVKVLLVDWLPFSDRGGDPSLALGLGLVFFRCFFC